MNLIQQGLVISTLGLSLTFAALALFILTIVTLQRLFPSRAVAPGATDPAPEQKGGDGDGKASDEEERIAAAIAIALSHAQARGRVQGQLGAALAAGQGRWWRAAAEPPPNGSTAHR